jgi:hypothetical protein
MRFGTIRPLLLGSIPGCDLETTPEIRRQTEVVALPDPAQKQHAIAGAVTPRVSCGKIG